MIEMIRLCVKQTSRMWCKRAENPVDADVNNKAVVFDVM